ncbi:hypothetical protein O181_117430 [Austropuccinia psidii MF-1]|uniref:Uncharacterized protein n=1 Tax=Austropuccinia psidii MF-1 TaxID=1389203 RepID=A0A9Q3PYD7_9BASI|nr:hypothetical protein [Austropuccinia psidii MF-1]
MRRSEGLITAKKWTSIATKRSRKPQTSASIQGKPTLTTCTGKITIINPAVTSKGKLPKSADNTFVQGTVRETLASKGTSQRTEKACPEPEDLEEDTLDTVVDGKTMREIISTLKFTLQFNSNLKPEDWKDMDQVLHLHQLLKDLFQWIMDNKRFNLASHWAELGASCQKICLKEIDFKDFLVITKGWNPTRQFRLLEARAQRIRENQATIQAIEEHLTKTGPTQIPSGSQCAGQISSPVASNHSETIPSGSQVAGQISSPVASHHSETRRSVAKSHHSSRFQEVSRRRQGNKGKEKASFNQRSSPSNRNITPTQTEHNIVTSESNINSDTLWLQMSQYAEQSAKQFAELEASHERMKKLQASMEKIVKSSRRTCSIEQSL